MQKYSNPFLAFTEAVGVFEHLGIDLVSSQWPNEIMHLTMERVYADNTHHFTMNIHLGLEGFREVEMLIGRRKVIPIRKEPYTKEYDVISIDPDPLLHIFCLIPKASVITTETEAIV